MNCNRGFNRIFWKERMSLSGLAINIPETPIINQNAGGQKKKQIREKTNTKQVNDGQWCSQEKK